MYRKEEQPNRAPEEFKLPFEGKLAEDNRWVIMTQWIPWSEFEAEYAELFSKEMGAPAKTFRKALGALIIKEKLGISDRETVEQIKENPYLQYFIGLSEYSNSAPFDASMLVHFRTRISAKLVNKVNQVMVKRMREATTEPAAENQSESDEVSERKNWGRLIADATCAPADITYPTDVKILNQAREKTKKIIDTLHKNRTNKSEKKPRTYRKVARKNYLEVAKQRQPSRKKRRKAIKKQLQYIKQNLGNIDQLIANGATLDCLNNRQYKSLLIVTEVYRQQQWMFDNHKQNISDRIVSLSQPHIRPIVRGKAGTPVEFGAKLSASCVDGYVFLDRISWDNFANIAAKWKRSYRGISAEEAWFILTNFADLNQALSAYQKRFGIEKMFRDYKNGGYNLESTGISGDRLIALIILITLAYTSSIMSGEKIKNKGVVKYVGRVKEKRRTQRCHSSFYIGIHGYAWVESLTWLNEQTAQLMSLSPHKRPYYQRGRRAEREHSCARDFQLVTGVQK